ncbi:MAG: PAS domain S-box protein, partial [Pseudomonadota bacterium]
MSNDQTSLNQDLLINFELTHAIGRTLDPEQTCNDLLALLLSRRNLTIGSVWLRSGAPANGNLDPAPSDNELVLLKAIPISRIERSRIDANHPAFAMDEHITVEAFYPNQTPVRVLERGVSTGRIALFRLGRIGYLRLFAADEERLSDRVVRQLETIIAKFAITLEACLSHQTLQSEVTRRETMQQALKASERRLRDFAATAADWFWETDAEGRFVYVSGSFESVSHIPITQIRGHTRDEVYKLLKTQMASEKNFRSILARREPFQNVEFEVRDSNQQRRILRVAGIPHFDANGAFAGYRGSGTDITAERESARDRERLEITLRHAQKMDAVGQLTGGIAHDFNNILASILGFGYLAEMLCHEKP